jgi:mono/diheme cytochrome c family protein
MARTRGNVRIRLAALTVALLAVIVASCGDDGEQVLDPGTTLNGTGTTGNALTDPGTIDEGGTTETTDEQGALVTGAHAYARLCSGCHGPEGQGGTGPALIGRDLDQQQVRDRLEQVHADQPEVANLPEDELDSISLYVAERLAR